MKRELVKNWMSTKIITSTPETTLAKAAQLMISNVVRRLPVVENGRLVGIVTYGDLRQARPSHETPLSLWESDPLAAQLNVSEVMTRQPVTVWQEATIGQAARLMLQNMVSGLPVMDHRGKLVGIITESDIFRLVAREWINEEEGEEEPVS